ncbi:MAG: HTH domain-containing protein [Nanoarchaeota archaeon]|nr:HTH domain-containing protein [Nanoarchaeota archaeon]
MPALFACKKIDLYEIMKCGFALTKTEHSILLFMVKENTDFCIKEISNKLSLERSTVQKSIKSLSEKGLILKKQQNLEEGGYRFCYFPIKKSIIKEKMMQSVHDWHNSVNQMINKW